MGEDTALGELDVMADIDWKVRDGVRFGERRADDSCVGEYSARESVRDERGLFCDCEGRRWLVVVSLRFLSLVRLLLLLLLRLLLLRVVV